MTITLDDLLAMKSDDLYAVIDRGLPLDLHAIADTNYTGIDLSMPAIFHKLAWRSFRKTFHRDPSSGVVRGWNVMVEQTGWDVPPAPKRDRHGKAKTFGHYEVHSAEGKLFPRNWRGGHYLDYRVAGNYFSDFPARLGYCPLVSVNPGSSELLLGWEIFKLRDTFVPLPDFWVLRREGPLPREEIVPRPVRSR